MADPRTKAELIEEIARLRQQLDEADSTLQAIRNGEVDAVVVRGPAGEQLYSLTTAERVYRLIVESMNEAALTVSPEGTILFANQRFCDMLRTPMPQTLGRKIWEFVALPQRSPLVALVEQARAEAVQRRLTLRAADGSAVPVQIAANPLESEAGLSVCLALTDLTELEASARSLHLLREQQDALQASEARYRALVEVAPDAIVVLQGGRIVYANPAALALYGAEREADLLVLDFVERIDPQDVARLDPLVPNPSLELREFGLRRLDGGHVPVELVAAATDWRAGPAVQVIMRDVSERKRIQYELQTHAEELQQQWEEMKLQTEELEQAQKELNASRQRYYDLYELAPAGYLTTDADGVIISANLRASRLLGAGKSGLPNLRITDFIAPEGQDTYYLWRRRLLESRSAERPCELPMRTAQGDPFWIRLDGNVDDAPTSGMHIRHSLIDITDRRRAEEALAEQIRNRAIVAATGTRLLEARTPGEVFAMIAEQLLRLAPGSIVVVSELLPGSNQMIVRSVDGPEGQIAKLEGILRASPVGLTFAPPPDRPLQEGLTRVEGLSRTSFGQLDAQTCRDLDAALGLGNVYTIPLVVEHELLGTVSLLTDRVEGLRSEQFVESLVSQAALALQRLRVEERLHESRERFRTFAEAMPQIVWSADARGETEYFNQRAIEYGGDAGAWNWPAMLHGADRERTMQAWRKALETGNGFTIEHRLRRQDGEYRWHLTRGLPLRDDAGRVTRWIGTSTEIHDQRRERQRLALRNAVTHALAAADSLEAAAPEVLRDLCRFFEWESAELWLVDAGLGRLVCGGLWHAKGEGLEKLANWTNGRSFDRGQGVVGRVWADGESVWIPDVTRTELPPRSGLAQELGLKAAMAFPVHLGDDILGVALAMARDPRQPDREVLLTSEGIGTQLGEFIRRKRAEAEVERLNLDLQQRVSELEAFFATVPIGLSIAEDPEARRIRGNPALERMLGVSQGAELSKGAPEPPGFRVLAEGRELGTEELPIQRAARGEPVVGQRIDIERADGTTVTSLSFGAPLRDESGRPRGAVAAFLDITALQQAQEALRLSEERYRALFEAMSEAFALHEIIRDEQGRPIDYRFLEVNPAFEQMTGLRAADVIGRTVREVLPGTEPTWIERYGLVTLTGKPDSFESYAQALGRWYSVHAFRAAPGQFAVVFVDITERKLAEQEFQQAVAEHAYDRLFAILREFQHGEGLAMVLHRIALFAHNVELLFRQPAGGSAEAEAADGSEAGFSDAGKGESLGEGEAEAVASGRSRLEAAVREYRTSGHQALLSLAALLRSVEREFDGGGPDESVTGGEVKALAETLSAGLGELMQAIEGDGPAEGGHERLPSLERAGLRVADNVEILQRKLAAAMRHLRTRYTADLGQVAQTIAQSFAGAAPSVKIKIEQERAGLRALIGPVDLSDLLKLLISNSLDAMSGVGSQGTADGEKAITVRVRTEGGTAVMEVEDTGPGVPLELRDRLFEKGFTTKGDGRGSGLSFGVGHLAKYGGKMAYDGSYTGGARFCVSLVRV